MKSAALPTVRPADIALGVTVLAAAYAVKLHYSVADAIDLAWILAPTAFIVDLLSGGDFTNEGAEGFVSRDFRFIIAPACAGVNFFIACFVSTSAAVLMSKLAGFQKGAMVIAGIAASYLATVTVNSIRILIGIWLHLNPVDFASKSQVHRVEGVVVYFGALIVLYLAFRSRVSQLGHA